MKLKNFLPAFLFLIVAILMAVSTKLGDKSSFYPSMIGKQIPAFEIITLDGENWLKSEELKSNAIVNLWASWCTGCRAEHDNLLALAKTHKIYGINSGDQVMAAQAYLAEHKDPFYKNGVDQQRRIALALGAQGLPETFVVGKDGIIYFHHRGALTARVINEELLPTLKQIESME